MYSQLFHLYFQVFHLWIFNFFICGFSAFAFVGFNCFICVKLSLLAMQIASLEPTVVGFSYKTSGRSGLKISDGCAPFFERNRL